MKTGFSNSLSGIVSALKQPLGYQILNLGFGALITLNAFIGLYEELIGRKALVIDVPAPPTEPLITYCDNAKARNLLGFAPQTAIATGLAETWMWFKYRYRV